MNNAAAELAKGAKIIDYSGDFRFNTAEEYAEYATRIGKDPIHAAPDLLPLSVYGAPELHRADINVDRKIVGNPGCFAISCILGLAPAANAKLFTPNSVICDCKSGISGAGKKLAATFHYPNRYDMMNAYKLAGHQHVCEIERELSKLAGEKIMLTFTSQVVPLCRGIMSCLYADLREDMTEEQVIEIYKEFYKDSPFVRVLPSTAAVGSMHVRGTNFTNLVISVDRRVRRLRVVSYIDNLVKGQAGSALQNMNLIFGLPETTGLDHPSFFP
jgi:N-acetyl-gamma-glutamyl-phosphate reductase